jgi:hypothetical protein
MAAELTRLTHKITLQLHLVAESCQSGNFWIRLRMSKSYKVGKNTRMCIPAVLVGYEAWSLTLKEEHTRVYPKVSGLSR